MVPPLAGVLVYADPPSPALPDIIGTNSVTVSMGSSASANATAIDNAVFDVGSAAGGGGTVIIPSGTWNCNPLAFNIGNVDLEVEGNLVAPTNATLPNWGGSTAFITWSNAKNSELVSLDGSYIDGEGGIGTNDWYANPGAARPALVSFSNPQTFLVQGLTFYNSPQQFFTFGGSKTNDITFNQIFINAPGTSPNTNGIDPDGNNFLITNSTIEDGDDNIAIQASGSDSPSTNIAITNLTIGTGHGISVGSGTTLGVNNVYVNNITFNGTIYGFRLKTEANNGGLVQNLSFNNVSMTNVFYPVYISSWYNGSGFSYPRNAASAARFNSVTNSGFTSGVTPQWENLTFNNITSGWTSTTATGYTNSIAGLLYGLPASVISNVNFNNVTLSAYQGMSLAYAGTNADPISFTGNWAINAATGQTFGTFTSPNNTTSGTGNPGNLLYWNGTSSTGGTFSTWETSNVVVLSVPEPTTASLAVASSALMLMRRRRNSSATADQKTG